MDLTTNERNNNFIEFITSFQKFLNAHDFTVTSADIEDFFRTIDSLDLKIEDKTGLSEASMSIFCKNRLQCEEYRELFNDFYDKNIVIKVSDDQISEFKDQASKAKEISDKKKKLNDLKENSGLENNGDNKRVVYKTSSELLSCVKEDGLKDLFNKLKEHGLNKKEAKELEEGLKNVLKDSIKSKHFSSIAKEITNIKKILQEIINTKKPLTIDQISANIEKLNKEEDDIKRKLEEGFRELQNNKDVYKQNVGSHRMEWTKQHGTVHSTYLGDIDFNKSFSKLTQEEKDKIKDFIKSQAMKFRTKATRDIRTKNSNKIDFRTTMKLATETGGIPLRLAYEKPKLNKSKIVMFLDVSGSCKDASELMLHFMYTIKEVFQGGVKCYVFVNSLFDVSEFLTLNSPDESIETIFSIVPRRGVYSDYHQPFQTFVNDHMSEITKDTIVYFIGDARNNKNASGEDNIKRITRKARKSFWLNTEESKMWNEGDSIMYKYAPYMKEVFEVLNTKDLLYSIENIF